MGAASISQVKLVPPDTGIVHQVNLEFLASVVMEKEIGDKKIIAYPDTLVGTDSHTPMINGLGILGWGVGGIEAEAALLGQPVTFVTPKVYGVHLTGSPKDGVTATDVVLTITQKLREIGVVDAFVEFFGDGVKALTVAGRATISNMTPEFGATVSLFPVDEESLRYLKLSGRPDSHIELVRKYFESQGMFGAPAAGQIDYSQIIDINLSQVEASVAGPTLPHERTSLGNVGKHFVNSFPSLKESSERKSGQLNYEGKNYTLSDGDVVIAAITSCTNTSNPSVMIAAGFLRRERWRLGLDVRRIVKTSMAPGSMVVTEYLKAMGLLPYLEKLGFGIVGYGCTTCIGNSGPLPEPVGNAIRDNQLTTAAVLSGNRNFEARIHQDVRANFLMSPPLVVAYALAGTVMKDLTKEPLGLGWDGHPVYLRDIWPSDRQILDYQTKMSPEMFRSKYAQVYNQNSEWNKLDAPTGLEYNWDEKSTYIQQPPYFIDYQKKLAKGAQEISEYQQRETVVDSRRFRDDRSHFSCWRVQFKIGRRKIPALKRREEEEFNTYGSRRGNHLVMIRGTFANPRIKNLILGGTEGAQTKHFPDGEVLPIYDASMKYQSEKIPLVVIAGKGFGTGSSRDWAAKGQKLPRS